MGESEQIRVLLVDDQPLLRTGFRLILEGEDVLGIVGEASDRAEAGRQTGELSPDVVLGDVRMPVLEGSKRREPSPPPDPARRSSS